MRLIKKLAGQTLIYGLGTIVPRVLNYAVLTFYYTRIFKVEEYGIIAELYAYITFLLIILTYGMETGFFRFSRNEGTNEKVYSSIMHCIFSTSVVFFVLVLIFSGRISNWTKNEGNEIYIILLSGIVCIDAFLAIPFAKLRYEEKAAKFALIKISNVVINIVFVLFFYMLIPVLSRNSIFSSFKALDIDVGFVLIANLITSSLLIILLWDEISSIKIGIIDWQLLKNIFIYSAPLLVAGLAGTINETIDRVLLKQIIVDTNTAEYMLGIYSANYKIAILLLIFIQMFRYAIEPFFFNYSEKSDAKEMYAKIMNVFVGSVLLIGVGIVLFINILKYFIASDYHEGLGIVPIVIASYILYGILFNLSVWYKLTNKTLYGAFILIFGSVITILINVRYVPAYGYYACAYAHLISYLIMVIISFFIGRKFYPINYNIKRIIAYFAMAIGIVIFNYVVELNSIGGYTVRVILIVGFGFIILKAEKVFELKRN